MKTILNRKNEFKAEIIEILKVIDFDQPMKETLYLFIDFLEKNLQAEKVNLFEFFTNDEMLLIYSTNKAEKQYTRKKNKNKEKICTVEIDEKYCIEFYFSYDHKSNYDYVYSVQEDIAFFINTISYVQKQKEDSQHYRLLFRLTKKFFNIILLDELLDELVTTINMLSNNKKLTIWLTHENYTNKPLPIKILDYQDELVEKEAIDVYMSGDVKIYTDEIIGVTSLYAPLKGKQGIYGVLQISSEKEKKFTREDVLFVSTIANTAGAAIENAQVFSQYKSFVNDLQFINETGQVLNECTKLLDTIKYSANRIINTFDAEEVGYILTENENEPLVLEGSTSYFTEYGLSKELAFIYDKVKESRESLYIGDFIAAHPEKKLPFNTVLAFPMLQGGDLKGISFVMHEKKYYFSFDTFKLLESFAIQTTLSAMNITLREELEEMVITDYLTKLYARKHFDKVVVQSLKVDTQGVFILIDIDNFKQFNDKYGHDIGDKVLIEVAQAIKKNIRDNDIAARWGGEELAVYLPNASLEVGKMVAKRLLETIPENTNPSATVSIGVTNWTSDTEITETELFKRADKALYEAKAMGKNSLNFY